MGLSSWWLLLFWNRGSKWGAQQCSQAPEKASSVVVTHMQLILQGMWDLPIPGNWTCVPCVGKVILHSYTTREAVHQLLKWGSAWTVALGANPSYYLFFLQLTKYKNNFYVVKWLEKRKSDVSLWQWNSELAMSHKLSNKVSFETWPAILYKPLTASCSLQRAKIGKLWPTAHACFLCLFMA